MKKTQQEIAYEIILANIINRTYGPGEPLREDKIADECGFSSTPVREAFRRLKMEGWLESEPYRGSFVKEFTVEEVNELYLLREAMEGLAVQMAVQNATEEDFNNIEKILNIELEFINGLSDSSGTTAFERPPGLDIQFHNALYSASHLKIIQQKMDIRMLQLHSMSNNPTPQFTIEEVKEIYEQHLAIYKAIKRGWADAAVALIKEHLSNARETLCIDTDKNSR